MQSKQEMEGKAAEKDNHKHIDHPVCSFTDYALRNFFCAVLNEGHVL